MHTSNTLSRLHNLTNILDNKDIIPLSFLQHFTPNYIEHAYLHWVENLYVHKTKDCDTTQVKRKHGRSPNKRLNKMKLKSQLQTHALHDLNKPIKNPKTKLLPGI